MSSEVLRNNRKVLFEQRGTVVRVLTSAVKRAKLPYLAQL